MKRIFLQTLLYLLLVAGVFGVLYRVWSLSGYTYGDSAVVFITCALSFLLSLLLIPAIHEAGHFVCGKASGWNLFSVSFAFLRLSEREGKIKAKVCNPFGPTAGECRMYPADGKNGRKKFLLYSAGGVLSTFIYFLVALLIVIFVRNGWVWATVGMTLPYCLYLILLNLLPFSSEKGDSDGAVFFGLLKGAPSQTVMLNLLTVQGFLSQGYSPAQIDAELYFDLPQLPEDDKNFSLLQLFRYYYYLDAGKETEAVRAVCRLEDCLEYIPESCLPAVCAELTYIYSVLKKDEELAERYYAMLCRCEEEERSAQTYRAALAYARLKNSEEEPAPVEEPLSGMKKLEERALQRLFFG